MNTNVTSKGKLVSRSRAGLLWGLLLFAGFQVVLGLTAELWRKELRDPEYGLKYHRLNRLLADHPERPLLLFLGSSRTNLGVRPDVLAETLSTTDRQPLVFNAAMNGAGTLVELLTLQRLLADGIRPRWVVIEILPPRLHLPEQGEVSLIEVTRLGWRDLAVLDRYQPASPQHLQAKRDGHSVDPLLTIPGPTLSSSQTWLQSRLLPVYYLRHVLLSWIAPAWLPWDRRQDHLWAGIDSFGWMPNPKEDRMNAEEYQRGVARAQYEHASSLIEFEVSPPADQAIREMIGTCREHGIEVVLLLMPEGSPFRSWYPDETTQCLYQYLNGIREEYDVTLIDARDWMPDAAFSDGHHLLADGAAAFSTRLGRELRSCLRSLSASAAQ